MWAACSRPWTGRSVWHPTWPEHVAGRSGRSLACSFCPKTARLVDASPTIRQPSPTPSRPGTSRSIAGCVGPLVRCPVRCPVRCLASCSCHRRVGTASDDLLDRLVQRRPDRHARIWAESLTLRPPSSSTACHSGPRTRIPLTGRLNTPMTEMWPPASGSWPRRQARSGAVGRGPAPDGVRRGPDPGHAGSGSWPRGQARWCPAGPSRGRRLPAGTGAGPRTALRGSCHRRVGTASDDVLVRRTQPWPEVQVRSGAESSALRLTPSSTARHGGPMTEIPSQAVGTG